MLRPAWAYLLEPGQAEPDVSDSCHRDPSASSKIKGLRPSSKENSKYPDQALPLAEFLLKFPDGLLVGKGLIRLTREGPLRLSPQHLVGETKSAVCRL